MCEIKNPYLKWDMWPTWPEVKAPVVPEIERVIFNGPATIVFWNDNTKTVVKCMEGELFDEEKGIAMAFMKKLYGKGYMNKIRRHIPTHAFMKGNESEEDSHDKG